MVRSCLSRSRFAAGRTLGAAVLALLLAVAPACAQQPASDDGAGAMSTADDSTSGALDPSRLAENIRMEVPQLENAELSMSELSASDVPGFRRGTLTVGGRNRLPVLVREDGQQVLVLAAEPIATGRSAAEVEAAQAEREQERAELLASAAEGMPSRGPDDAPVTLIEFSDFQCPYCNRGRQVVDRVIQQYPDRVRVVFLHFPLPNHDWARPAAVAAQCAARQSDEAFWTLHDAYFNNQGAVTTGNVMDRAASVLAETSVDMETWRACARDSTTAAHRSAEQAVEASMSAGRELGVQGTPAFFLNGEMIEGAQPFEVFQKRIEAATDSR
jgi:protein-disulfide isomerase